ncbi:GNAT family N-acetyltransferase, partial [Acidimicrobiaceae bacterium AH-315-P05]|nr:GNAT family N-acetyltransferase [Acidimicrobiaceae bacterium AH-315-P05]
AVAASTQLDLNAADISAAFVAGTLRSMNCESSLADVSGVTLSAAEERQGTGVAAGYELGRHLVISVDPDLLKTVRSLVGELEPTRSAWSDVAVGAGASVVGSATMLILAQGALCTAQWPDLYRSVGFDPRHADGLRLIEDFITRADESDIDDAEIDVDDPDDVARIATLANHDDSIGESLAYAGARPWNAEVGYSIGVLDSIEFRDLGILVLPEVRRRGVGAALVSDLCRDIFERGHYPLYRRNDNNLGSVGIAVQTGFQASARLTAVRF